ncbi:TetR/AcrR family transcriptional regulator [Streptomyces sp. enrichment culture]|uniref:TetR/AcrR family transcriptional regulator n=1 Tax=Streptomyces sp. enrichment culture TaxID=1795815 RepID=UPI003F550D55
MSELPQARPLPVASGERPGGSAARREEEERMAGDVRVRRRQARGEQRMAQILDAAATVFARAGYEKATTIAIAAEAGISPGSLYQFFPNKEAIAQALADRFVVQLRTAHSEAFGSLDPAALDFDDLLDRVVDPLIAFNLANPGFKALFARTDMPTGLTDAARPVNEAFMQQIDALFTARAPGLPEAERLRTARVAIQLFSAMVSLVVAAEGGEREAMTGELKKALRGYLAPVLGRAGAGRS